MDSFATAISLSLQHGVPMSLLVDKFAHTRFEPSGFSQHPKIGYAKSIMDYIFRWLRIKFSEAEQGTEAAQAAPSVEEFPLQAAAEAAYAMQLDAPPCPECGGITRRSGSCYLCASCGSTTGCS
jgi:ribonucleoside-diphosphate reductase alpha chain